jgi:hypothetical protein
MLAGCAAAGCCWCKLEHVPRGRPPLATLGKDADLSGDIVLAFTTCLVLSGTANDVGTLDPVIWQHCVALL